ncbi:MAG: right-handed parallel beta-helix repeat-containing protein, partial [Archaeoglobaceae archaeon]
MNVRLVLAIVLLLVLSIGSAQAWTGTIYLRADGSVEPSDAPLITSNYVTYNLTDDVNTSVDGIVVERDNIVINGNGHSVTGQGSGCGIKLENRINVTITNVTVESFEYGICLSTSSNNVISNSSISNNTVSGIFLVASSNNTISNNSISNNGVGIYLGLSSNNVISNNSISDNVVSGIFLTGSLNNIISNNSISNNYYIGIHLVESLNTT